MNKTIINVPKGVRYISQWKEFSLPEHPCIINKQICGCGFTEWCLTNSDNVILVSPRKVLLENKADQHKEDHRLLYVRNDSKLSVDYEKDLSREYNTVKGIGESEDQSELVEDEVKVLKMREAINTHYLSVPPTKGCKFSVTYDSFRHIKEVLGDVIKSFYIVIDEMQSIFVDAKFKSTTGIELLKDLQGLSRVCFVSATPMLDKYLEMLDDFKDIDYIGLDWGAEDPIRVTAPQVKLYPCVSVLTEASKVISSYREGNFEIFSYRDSSGKINEIISNEAVMYVNSVRVICEIIKRNGLTLEETNVICADTGENKKKLRQAFGIKKKNPEYESGGRGTVPVKGEPHKMFTLCTRTVYLGCDFYSKCARSFVFSDANVDSLSVDVSLDLPQILGRQRLNENPWKNRAVMFYKLLRNDKKLTKEKFMEIVKTKKEKTDSLLRSFSKVDVADKQILADSYRQMAKAFNYKDNYVSVNEHAGGILVPEFNELVLISDLRGYEVQQLDYLSDIMLFSAVDEVEGVEIKKSNVHEALIEFESFNYFTDKLKYVCNVELNEAEFSEFINRIPIVFKNYYNIIGPEKCRALKYQNSLIKKEYETQVFKQNTTLADKIYETFKVGKRYTKQYIKEELGRIYEEFEKDITPKATDLLDWFQIIERTITNKETGKRDNGFEILRKL